MVKKPIRYPSGMKRTYQKPAVPVVKNRGKANLGKVLEGYIDSANETYSNRNRATVIKQHPEIKVTKMEKNTITEGFWKEKGAPDYVGITNGRAFIFDCKETTDAKSFPLKNVKDHQVRYLEQTTDQGGLGFLLIRFVKHHEVYVLTYDQLKDWWEGYTGDGRKSIPYDWIALNCELVGPGGGITLDYLSVVHRFLCKIEHKM